MTIEEIDRKLEAARAVLLGEVSTRINELRAELVEQIVPQEPKKTPAQAAHVRMQERSGYDEATDRADEFWMFKEGVRQTFEELRKQVPYVEADPDGIFRNWGGWSNEDRRVFDEVEKKMTKTR